MYKLWLEIRLAWHTGRAIRHDELAEKVAKKLHEKRR